MYSCITEMAAEEVKVIINIEQLSGKSLDWAVAKTLKKTVEVTKSQFGGLIVLHKGELYSPTKNWNQTGELIDLFPIELMHESLENQVMHYATLYEEQSIALTAQEAICLVVVLALHGSEIEVPDELVEVMK